MKYQKFGLLSKTLNELPEISFVLLTQFFQKQFENYEDMWECQG